MKQPPPRHARITKAVAPRQPDPRIGAPPAQPKGQGRLAERMMSLAREQGLTLRQDPGLAEVLARLELDQEIPPELYLIAGEVLFFTQQADQAWAAGQPQEPSRGDSPPAAS